jgi:predicted nucleotidyltransferase
MGKYTSSAEADKKVEKDIKKIKEVLVKRFRPISIILFGGFGRGEGTFEIVNKKIVPLNDYDMYVVTKNKISDEELEKAGEECSRLIGRGGGEFVENYNEIYEKNKYFHVDLRWLGYNQLTKLRKINRTYELKYGSTVIYGEDVRKKIKEIKVPLSEAFRYLINPACHLLLCMDERRLKGKFLKDEKFYLMHHIIKTYLACASSLIISEGKFKANYSDTVKECAKIYKKEFPELVKKIEQALKMKLFPKRNTKNIRKRWFEAINDLTFVLKYIAKKNYQIEAKNIIDLTRKLYNKLPYVYFTPYLPLPEPLAKIAFPSQYLLNLSYFIRTKHFQALSDWKDVGLRIAMAGFLLLHGIDNPEVLEEAFKYVKTFASVKDKTWKNLRTGLLYGFDKYYSQKII